LSILNKFHIKLLKKIMLLGIAFFKKIFMVLLV
jgi:hypothetical protein